VRRRQGDEVGSVFFCLFRERAAENGIDCFFCVGGGVKDEAVTLFRRKGISQFRTRTRGHCGDMGHIRDSRDIGHAEHGLFEGKRPDYG
jgi:hypothetical protein